MHSAGLLPNDDALFPDDAFLVSQVMRMMADEDVKIFSLTITEFGYTVPTTKADIHLLEVAREAATRPWDAMNLDRKKYQGATALGLIVAGLASRRVSGSGGATVMSCDNIPHNGKFGGGSFACLPRRRAALRSIAPKGGLGFS